MAFGTKKDRQRSAVVPVRPRGRTAPSPAALPPASLAGAVLHLQRTAGNGVVQRMLVQASHKQGEGPAPAPVEEAVDRARGGGQALEDGVRAEMEGAFGVAFDGVRIHTGGTADLLSRSVAAHAFTTGRDIFFREGAYEPRSAAGRTLLAHELTHVVQQGGPELQPKLVIGDAGDEYEQEADRVASAIVRMPATGEAMAGPVPGIQRACTDCEEELSRKAEE